jgi:hypothetical protein
MFEGGGGEMHDFLSSMPAFLSSDDKTAPSFLAMDPLATSAALLQGIVSVQGDNGKLCAIRINWPRSLIYFSTLPIPSR